MIEEGEGEGGSTNLVYSSSLQF